MKWRKGILAAVAAASLVCGCAKQEGQEAAAKGAGQQQTAENAEKKQPKQSTAEQGADEQAKQQEEISKSNPYYLEDLPQLISELPESFENKRDLYFPEVEALREELYQTYPFDSMENIRLNVYTGIHYSICEAWVSAYFTFSPGTEPEVMEEAGIYVLSQLDSKIAPDLQVKYLINCVSRDYSSDEKDEVSLRIENYHNQGRSSIYSPFWRLKKMEAWLSTPDKDHAPYSFSQESLAVLEQGVQYENENPGEIYLLQRHSVQSSSVLGKVGDVIPEGQYRMKVVLGMGSVYVKNNSETCSALYFEGDSREAVFEHVFLQEGMDIKLMGGEYPFLVECTAE